MLGFKQQRLSNAFEILKCRFPHVDLEIVNPELSFSQNLQNIVTQLGLPSSFEVGYQITNMKQAVDKQELKIQKSLVNDQNIDINNTVQRREYMSMRNWDDLHMQKVAVNKAPQYPNQLIEQIWMFQQSINARTDWFQH